MDQTIGIGISINMIPTQQPTTIGSIEGEKRMKFGIRFDISDRRFVFAINPDYFSWTPGLIESGSASPGEYFDCRSDTYHLWGWIGLTVFYARKVIP